MEPHGSVVVLIFQVLKWVEETVQAMKVHLLSSNHDSAQENKWEMPFDPSLREVTVSLSGPAPQIELRDPFGRLHSTLRHYLLRTIHFSDNGKRDGSVSFPQVV